MTTSGRTGVTSQQTSHCSADSLTGAPLRAFRHVAGILRLSLGWVFLWAFLDKAFEPARALGAVAYQVTGPDSWRDVTDKLHPKRS